MRDGFLKIACAAPPVRVADCIYNCTQTVKAVKEAAANGARLLVLPELGLTGYTCGDLFGQRVLLEGAWAALEQLLAETKHLDIVFAVGLPIALEGARYNCAAVCLNGEILGMVPKKNLPNYGEFYELRHFTPGTDADGSTITYNGRTFPFGACQTFSCRQMPDFVLGVEICEDLWVSDTPSVRMAQQGATVIANLSCSDEIIGKENYRRTLIAAKSGSLYCTYAYADAGMGESTQDMVFAGHHLIYENGSRLAESPLFDTGMLFAVTDTAKLTAERLRSNTFNAVKPVCRTQFSLPVTDTALDTPIPAHPFVPDEPAELSKRCEIILHLQAAGLATRLRHIGTKNAVVGLSGGLDSTLALIVMAHAFKLLGLPAHGMTAVTMPCFGTTDRTYRNACRLAQAYGAELREIRIEKSVRQHFCDIGHDEALHDVTYENAQARERTQVLMDIANQTGGIVVGTGDLSELALGWATYNGDHMSMYAVNAGVPKTLVRYLVAHEAAQAEESLGAVLRDVLDTPVSPELLPPEADGTIAQRTEELVGPYELHDFFLYYLTRFGFTPRKILRMAENAFAGVYDTQTIEKWLHTFCRRFFTQQFKRSCLPDGPKVGSVTLSPRGDWRMPSDAWSTLWKF